jgi:hypothetical protein
VNLIAEETSKMASILDGTLADEYGNDAAPPSDDKEVREHN